MSVWPYIAVMAIVTYAVRAIPMTVFRREIKNRYVLSFLHYVPYATLSVMTFPAILSAGGTSAAGWAAFIAAVVLALAGQDLPRVSAAACVAAFIAGFIG